MPDLLSLNGLLHLPGQEAESHILQLPPAELAALRADLESFIRNASANILEQLSYNTLQTTECLPNTPFFKNAKKAGIISASERDLSLRDARQMLLESHVSITENLNKLHSSLQEEDVIGQIERLLHTTLNLGDHLDEACSSETADNGALVTLLSQSLQLHAEISRIDPPSYCTAIFSRLKHTANTLHRAVLSHVEATYLSNLVCLASPQSQKIYDILLDYNEVSVIVCKNFTAPLLQKLNDHAPLQLLENIAVLISRLLNENDNSWIALLYRKFSAGSESARYSIIFHQCLTIPLINFLQAHSKPAIPDLSYLQSLRYLRGMHKIYSNALVDPWPDLKDSLLLESKITYSIDSSFGEVALLLKDLNTSPQELDLVISKVSNRFCQVFDLFLRPPAEALSETAEIPCGYFVPALVDKVLNSLSSALRRLATQLSLYKKEKFYKMLIDRLYMSLISYSQSMSMTSGLLEFTNALPILKGPQSVPQIQELYLSALKEYLEAFISWLHA
ncbi:Hypothetical protein GSB_153511 [Giardia duodenalis]|uniref:Uncharacterized protein n=1 Tax=Giardia intestinalis TaxID=5741 RepID=V6TUW9_GIAIN|nr:Hypothetical protein GSB_153511 [Giardia intestinalis]